MPLGCDDFWDPPSFLWPSQFWGFLVRYFIIMPLNWNVWYFPPGATGIMGLWRDTRPQVPLSSHHIKNTYYHSDLSLLMLTLVTWLRWYLSGFYPVKLPHIHTVLFQRKSLHTLSWHLGNEELCSTSWKMGYLHKFMNLP